MRILLCCNAYPPNFVGGAELVAHYQGLVLKQRGHDVRVFAGERAQATPRHDLSIDRYEGLDVFRVLLTLADCRREAVNFAQPLAEEHFRKLLIDFRPHIVHFHNLAGLSLKIIRMAREFGARTLMTLHDHWGFCLRNTLVKADETLCSDFSACSGCQSEVLDTGGRHVPIHLRQDYFSLMMREVEAFVSPSRYLADAYLRAGFPPGKMRVIWNGLDVDRYSNASQKPVAGKVRFTFIGTFGRHKGVHVLLGALPLLRHRNRVEVNLVGDGGQLPEYQKQLRQHHCEALVHFRGKLANSDIPGVLRQTDVFVLPSIWPENQPVSITEAMASGVAVIASNLGGIPELVEDGKTGYLFEAGNSANLAEKMDALIEAPELIEAFGKAARERMRDNSFQMQVEKLEHLYSDVLESPTAVAGSKQPEQKFIACMGAHVDTLVAEALQLLPLYYTGQAPLLVMADWLTESQVGEAALLWVSGPMDQWAALAAAGRYVLPLLVPESCDLLTTECRARNCGLYFADAHEAAACIGYLLTHERERLALADNLQRAFCPPDARAAEGGCAP